MKYLVTSLARITLLATSLGMSVSLVKSETITNFNKIATRLQQGKSATLVVDLSSCSGKKKHLHELVAGVSVDAFLLRPRDSLSFSDHHISGNSKSGFIEELVKYRLSKDGELSLTVLRSARRNDSLKTTSLKCHLGSSARFVFQDR